MSISKSALMSTLKGVQRPHISVYAGTQEAHFFPTLNFAVLKRNGKIKKAGDYTKSAEAIIDEYINMPKVDIHVSETKPVSAEYDLDGMFGMSDKFKSLDKKCRDFILGAWLSQNVKSKIYLESEFQLIDKSDDWTVKIVKLYSPTNGWNPNIIQIMEEYLVYNPAKR